ncbi:MAG: aspartate kinase, partial [Oscillospiraceae bacterium]|nr:aspartate kinase [Oscillospiraceae bacterium]
MGYKFIDAADYIHFNENGSLNFQKTKEDLKKVLTVTFRAVLPGFYGSLPNGKIHTFSRGGSDVTGSIVARAVHADIYENWTDVSGMLAADPRIVENPRQI